MDGYLVLTRKIDELYLDLSPFAQRFAAFAGSYPDIYQSFMYCKGTGYAHTVGQEIDLVIQAESAATGAVLAFDEFVNDWGFKDQLDTPVLELSGGWQKYLGLALFCNRATTIKLLIDAGRQIAPSLLEILFTNLNRGPTKISGFLEYDASLLKTFALTEIYDYSACLSSEPPAAHYQDDPSAESNYDDRDS